MALAKLVQAVPVIGNSLEKVRSRPWAQPLGKCLQVTGVIMEIAGECGVPVIGLVGQALSVGADLLSESGSEIVQIDSQLSRNLQQTLNKLSKKMDVISDGIDDIKKIAEATQQLVADIRYKDGIEKIDAAYETLMQGANNLEQTLRSFDNYMIELQTNANQYFKPEKIVEYLGFVKRKDYEKAMSYFLYVIATRAKYLQLLSIYYIQKKDRERVLNEYLSFNNFCKELCSQMIEERLDELLQNRN